MSDMREEFEKWALKHTTLCLDRHKTGNYMKYASNVAWRAWQAARTVPEGFVMVPVEPTPEMIDTVLRYANGDDLSFYGADELRKEVKHDWALMLSAAPEGKK